MVIEKTSPILTDRLRKHKLGLNILQKIYRIALSRSDNPVSAARLVYKLKQRYKEIFDESLFTKIAEVEGRYFWRLTGAGFPSPAFDMSIETEIDRIKGVNPFAGLRTVIMGITKKCSLNCEHCFEWDDLNKKDVLSVDDIVEIIDRYREYGSSHFMLSGGEPMLRIHDIYKILEKVKEASDFWIITSGINFSRDHAHKLKEAGLTGVMISLDHYIEDKHNKFRGSPSAFMNAMNAAEHATEAGLVTTFSLCATKEFTTKENLENYMDLAREKGVAFVQIQEPKAAGRYANKEIKLADEQVGLLEDFYRDYNRLPEYEDYPIINYVEYHQRRSGCFGAGNRFLYIDTNGDVRTCPVCRIKTGNALDNEPAILTEKLRQNACLNFDNANF